MLKNCQKWGYFVQVIVDISTCFLYIIFSPSSDAPSNRYLAISYSSLFFFYIPTCQELSKSAAAAYHERTKHHPWLSFERLSHHLLPFTCRSVIGISTHPRSRKNRGILFSYFHQVCITSTIFFDSMQHGFYFKPFFLFSVCFLFSIFSPPCCH